MVIFLHTKVSLLSRYFNFVAQKSFCGSTKKCMEGEMVRTREVAETALPKPLPIMEGKRNMILNQRNQRPISVNTAWAKATQIGEKLYLIGAALVLFHIVVEVGMIIGAVGKFYPVPQWVWEELNLLVFFLTPIIWFRLLCVISTHTLKFSQKENYFYVAIASGGAFAAALQSPTSWYPYLAFPLLSATYVAQFILDSRLPLRKERTQAACPRTRHPATTGKGGNPYPFSSQHPPSARFSQLQSFAQTVHRYSQTPAPAARHIGIWCSPTDARFADRLRKHLQPKIWRGQIDLWDSEQIPPGSLWQEERAYAIQSADVVVILVSADLLASDLIARDELPQILLRSKLCGTLILLLYTSPCDISGSGLEEFYPVNLPDKPLAKLEPVDRERLLVQTVSAICRHLKL